MGNVFRVINYDGDIEISIYKKANAVFKTNEYDETEDACIYKETINIFNLLKENQELKSQLKGTTHCFDEEEHRELKKQLHEASIKIQEMTEQDIECPSNCEKLRKLKKKLEEKENIACYWKDSCLENAGKIEILETQQKEFIKYLEDEITNTVNRKEQLRNKEAILILEVRISEDNIILQKYKQTIGDDK